MGENEIIVSGSMEGFELLQNQYISYVSELDESDEKYIEHMDAVRKNQELIQKQEEVNNEAEKNRQESKNRKLQLLVTIGTGVATALCAAARWYYTVKAHEEAVEYDHTGTIKSRNGLHPEDNDRYVNHMSRIFK